MNFRTAIFLLVCSLSFASCATKVEKTDPAFEHFITVEGTMLYDGDEPFRFLSFNVPTLNYVEDNMQFTNPNPYGLPSSFELHDVFKTINQLGGRVVRSYTIPVHNKNFPKEAITFVEAPGVFNEEAFRKLDEVIALAGEYKIRLVIPLLNNWQWMGGRPNYADFRGKTEDEFWTDEQLIADFKQTIAFVLNRVNTITGIPYKDDPTIMAWETGNELQNPPEWGVEIARYIKSIDPKHLVIDGFHAIHLEDHSVWIQQYSIDEPAIDMINTHHYEPNATETIANLKKTVEMIGGKKPVFLGEFGFISTTGIERILDYVINEPAIPGGFIWSLRRHHPEGGFYHHSEPVGYGLYRAYHWPGFDDGESYDERNLLALYQQKAFEIQNQRMPEIVPPEPPTLLPFSESPIFSWQGSVGAYGYDIQRATSAEGPWKTIVHNIDDIETPGFALYSDTSGSTGAHYFYRVIARNQAGESSPSNFVEITIDYKTLVDGARNLSVLDDSEGVEIKTRDYRSFKEAYSRLHGNKGSSIRYIVPGEAIGMTVYAYERGDTNLLSFALGDSNTPINSDQLQVDDFALAETNYDYLIPRRYNLSLDGHNNVTINFSDTADIVRVEMFYRD